MYLKSQSSVYNSFWVSEVIEEIWRDFEDNLWNMGIIAIENDQRKPPNAKIPPIKSYWVHLNLSLPRLSTND